MFHGRLVPWGCTRSALCQRRLMAGAPEELESDRGEGSPGEQEDFNIVRLTCRIPEGVSMISESTPTGGESVAYAIYAARGVARFTRTPGRTRTGFARDGSQSKAEARAVKLIMADVFRRMWRAGEGVRADRLRAGGIPEGQDFHHFAAHVGGLLQVVPLGSGCGPTTFGQGDLKLVLGMMVRGEVVHVELLRTEMQGERSSAWLATVLTNAPNHVRVTERGHEDWVIRGRPTEFRGAIALAEEGMREIVARARLSDCIQIDEADLGQPEPTARRTPATPPANQGARQLYAWVLEDVVLERPPLLSIPQEFSRREGLLHLPDGEGGELPRSNKRPWFNGAEPPGHAARWSDAHGMGGGLDGVLRHVALKCQGVELTTRGVKFFIRNLGYTRRSTKTCAVVVDDVLDALVEGGLAEVVDRVMRHRSLGDRSAAAGLRPLARRCRWKTWAAIQENPASADLAKRLGLGEANFPRDVLRGRLGPGEDNEEHAVRPCGDSTQLAAFRPNRGPPVRPEHPAGR